MAELSKALQAAHAARAKKHREAKEKERKEIEKKIKKLLADPNLSETFREKLTYAHQHADTNDMMKTRRDELIREAERGLK